MEVNKNYFEDCYDVLTRLPDGCVDFMPQDTPFGVTKNKWDIKPDLPKMWEEWLRVGKENCAYLFFATQPFASELIMSMPKLFRYDLIWYKRLGTGFLNAGKMPMRNHEHILLFYRKLPTYNPQLGIGIRKQGKRDNTRTNNNYGKFSEDKAGRYDDNGIRQPQSVLDFTNGDRQTGQDHPTQKPIDLIRYLILTYSNENDLVFDGYAGSGTTAEACIKEKRNFIVCENKEDYHKMVEKRIATNLSTQQLF